MPLERVKQGYKDLSMSFRSNPLNDDLIGLKNESAIARSIKNLVFTRKGEKFFDPDFGSEVSASLFENIDEVTAITIQDDIEYMIKMHEPRVKLINVESIPNYDNNQFDVVIVYQILGADTPPQELEFVLLPSR
jgi:phage baseplate assembly protein W